MIQIRDTSNLNLLTTYTHYQYGGHYTQPVAVDYLNKEHVLLALAAPVRLFAISVGAELEHTGRTSLYNGLLGYQR